VVDHRGGFHDPRIGSAGVPAAASRCQKGNVAEPTRVKKARTGHTGAARALAENRDATRDIYAERCACCAALEEAGQELARAWDHVDLPPIKPITTRISLFRADAGGHLRYR
jgi:transposase